MAVSTTSIVSLGAATALLFLLPLAAVLWWKLGHKTSTHWRFVLFGALGFLVSARVLEAGVHMVCIVLDSPVSRFINGHTWAYALYGCAMAGIFEECGRWVILKYLVKKNKTRENALLYGLGHWGIEVWTVVLPNLILALAMGLTIQAQGLDAALAAFGVTPEVQASYATFLDSYVFGFGPLTAALNVLERVLALFLQVGLTIVVYYGAGTDNKRYLWWAVLAHGGTDLLAALYQRGVVSLPLAELWFLLWAVGVSLWATKLYRRCKGLDTAACPDVSCTRKGAEGMHWKKLIAPIIITVLVCIWFLFYIAVVLWIPGLPTVVRILGAVIPALLGGVAIYNLIQRIQEIRSGEEDDLDNY